MNDIENKQKLKEEELRESEEKYREAYGRVSFYKDLFVHDINNILQNILSSVELSEIYLDKKENQDKLSELLEVIKDQVKKSSNLISRLRELTNIEAPLEIQRIEVQNRLKKIIDFIKNTVQDKNIEIKIESLSQRNYVQANNLLEDIFENILINAVKHNDNPTIEILIKFTKEQENGKNFLKLEFIDNGRGIPDNKKEIIFQLGYKLHQSSKGMGIGLSLVKKIINSYDGKIWVEDRVKGDYAKGSNFVLLIPISKNKR